MHNRRLRQLVDNRLQLQLSAWFVGVAALSMVFAFFAFTATMSRYAMELPNDAKLFLGGWMDAMIPTFLAAMGIVLSLTFIVGIVAMHRIAGPIYRFSRFLEALERGEQPVDCRLRKKDQLQDFCTLLNRATAPMRVARNEHSKAA